MKAILRLYRGCNCNRGLYVSPEYLHTYELKDLRLRILAMRVYKECCRAEYRLTT